MNTELHERELHAEVALVRERVHKLTLVREIAAFHRSDKMHYLRLQERLAVGKKNNGFDRSEVLAERQRKIQGRVCSVDDPNNSKIEIYFEQWRLPPQS